MTPVRPSVNTPFSENRILPSRTETRGAPMPRSRPSHRKRAAPEGAAKFREETSKKAAGGEPSCCGAQISPSPSKRKSHSLASRYSLTARVFDRAAKVVIPWG
jgi:hypothetical protein